MYSIEIGELHMIIFFMINGIRCWLTGGVCVSFRWNDMAAGRKALLLKCFFISLASISLSAVCGFMLFIKHALLYLLQVCWPRYKYTPLQKIWCYFDFRKKLILEVFFFLLGNEICFFFFNGWYVEDMWWTLSSVYVLSCVILHCMNYSQIFT